MHYYSIKKWLVKWFIVEEYSHTDGVLPPKAEMNPSLVVLRCLSLVLYVYSVPVPALIT